MLIFSSMFKKRIIKDRTRIKISKIKSIKTGKSKIKKEKKENRK